MPGRAQHGLEPDCLEFLEKVARPDGSPLQERPAPRRAIRERIDEFTRAIDDDFAPPADLIARPCPHAPAVWHRDRLFQLLEHAGADAASSSRAGYHARWLAHLGDPAAHHPRVSVVIPVYNRAKLVVDAVESALSQTHPAVQVIVIDDGSTDELRDALRPYAKQILLRHQTNGGVSAARNHGLRLAEGDYVHFLDSDNSMDPDAVERWLAAFRSVPDAELCYGQPRTTGTPERHAPPARTLSFLRVPDGGSDCPTTDLLRSVAGRHHPFAMAGVLVARWVTLEVGDFNENLRRGEDTRYWFQLGLRNTKVVGLRRELNCRRLTPGSLSSQPREEGSEGRVALLNFLDVLHHPKHWIHAGDFLRYLTVDLRWRWVASTGEPIVVRHRERLVEEIERLGRPEPSRRLSPLPLLHLCAAAVREAATRLGDLGRGESFHARFLDAVDRSLRTGRAPGPEDLAYWTGSHETRQANAAAVEAVRRALG